MLHLIKSCKNIRESAKLNIVYSNLCNSAQFHSICNQFAVFMSILQVVEYIDNMKSISFFLTQKWWTVNFPLQHRYIIQQAGNEKKRFYQLQSVVSI